MQQIGNTYIQKIVKTKTLQEPILWDLIEFFRGWKIYYLYSKFVLKGLQNINKDEFLKQGFIEKKD